MNKLIAKAIKYLAPETAERMEIKAFNKYALGLYPHTPDINYLEEKSSHLLFVCDDTQDGFENNKLLQGGIQSYTAFTVREYGMWVRLSDMLPIPLRIDKSSLDYPARIKGQLWIVPTEVLISLDNLRKNGVEFSRQRVRVEIPYRIETYKPAYGHDHPDLKKWVRVLSKQRFTEDQIAWIYMGKRTFWNNHISHLDYRRVNRFHPKECWIGTPYYCFTKLELGVK